MLGLGAYDSSSEDDLETKMPLKSKVWDARQGDCSAVNCIFDSAKKNSLLLCRSTIRTEVHSTAAFKNIGLFYSMLMLQF